MFQRNGQLLYKRFIGYFVPTVLMSLALSLSIVVDGVIVGNILGSTALAAVNLILPLTMLFALISALFGVGGTVLTALHLGRREAEEANQSFTVSLVALAIGGILVWALMMSFTQPLAAALSGGDAELEPLAGEYLHYMRWCAPLMIFTTGFAYFIRTDGQPTLAAMIMATANVLNLILDIILIRYLNSIKGASLATAIGYAGATLMLTLYIFSPHRTLRITGRIRSAATLLRSIVKSGFPSALDYGLLFLKITCINSIVLALSGTSGMAAFSVCLSCLSLVSTFISGGANTMMPIVGVLYGEEDYPGIRFIFRRSLLIILTAATLLTIFFEIYPTTILGLFGVVEAKDLDVGIPAIRIFALSFIGIGFSYIMKAYYQTVKRTGFATGITLIDGLIVIIPAAWLLSRVFGLTGVWISFAVAEAATVLYVAYITDKERKRSGNPATGMLLLPETVTRGDVLDSTIGNTLEEAVGLSEEIRTFCRSRDVDESTANKVAIAVEEIVVNTIKHGYGNGKKSHVDAGMLITEDEIRVTIRDDGGPFNPLEYRPEEEGEFAIQGLRILKALAIELSYTYTLNFNSTLIVVPRSQSNTP